MKKLLAKRVAEKVGVSTEVANRVITEFLKELKEEVVKRGRVTFRGFGRFYLKRLRERKGCNPKSGEKITIPERLTIRFKASKKLF